MTTKISKQEAARRYDEYLRRQTVNNVVAKSQDDWLLTCGLVIAATSDSSSYSSSCSYSDSSSSGSCGD